MLLIQAAAPSPAVDQEVVVIARRLDRFRAAVAFDSGGAHCDIKVSSGDPEADAVGCQAITICYPSLDARRTALSTAPLKDHMRRKMSAAIDRDLHDCFVRKTTAGIAALAAKRAGKGT